MKFDIVSADSDKLDVFAARMLTAYRNKGPEGELDRDEMEAALHAAVDALGAQAAAFMTLMSNVPEIPEEIVLTIPELCEAKLRAAAMLLYCQCLVGGPKPNDVDDAFAVLIGSDVSRRPCP